MVRPLIAGHLVRSISLCSCGASPVSTSSCSLLCLAWLWWCKCWFACNLGVVEVWERRVVDSNRRTVFRALLGVSS